MSMTPTFDEMPGEIGTLLKKLLEDSAETILRLGKALSDEGAASLSIDVGGGIVVYFSIPGPCDCPKCVARREQEQRQAKRN